MSYYPSACEQLEPHCTDPCESREYARLRSTGFIRMGYTFDPTSAAAWLAGIAAGQIVVIPETNGESPYASPRLGPPYGTHGDILLGYDFSARYEDPNYNCNCDFYNSIIGNLNYRFFYRTSSHVYITDTPATIVPNRDIANDLADEITWSIDVRWISRTFACGVPTPDGVFDIEVITAPPTGPTDPGPCADLTTQAQALEVSVTACYLTFMNAADQASLCADTIQKLKDILDMLTALCQKAQMSGCTGFDYTTALSQIQEMINEVNIICATPQQGPCADIITKVNDMEIKISQIMSQYATAPDPQAICHDTIAILTNMLDEMLMLREQAAAQGCTGISLDQNIAQLQDLIAQISSKCKG